jgi:hypothetical protein
VAVGKTAARRWTIHCHQKANTMPSQRPMHLTPRCGARTRGGNSCRAPAMPNGRCRMHGGPSPGAPKGNKNALKHGLYTAEAPRAASKDVRVDACSESPRKKPLITGIALPGVDF